MEPAASDRHRLEVKSAGLRAASASTLVACAGLGIALLVASLGLDPLSPLMSMATGLIMTLFAWVSWELAADAERTPLGALGWALVALAAAYLLGCAAAVNRGAALHEAIVYAAYVPGFWLARHAGRSEAARHLLLDIVVGAGTAVAAVGILAALGVLPFAGAVLSGRLASTMLYPNALAIYLLWGLLVGCCRWAQVASLRAPAWGLPYVASCTVMAVGLVMTFSRGTLVAGVAGMTLLLVMMPRGRRLPLAMFLLAVGLPAAAAGLSIANAVEKGWTVPTAALTVGGVVAALGVGMAAGMLLRVKPGARRGGPRAVVVCAAVLAAVVAVGAAYCWHQLHGPLVVRGAGPGVASEVYIEQIELAAGQYRLSGTVRAAEQPAGMPPGEWNVAVREAGGDYHTLASAKGEPTVAGEGFALEFEVPPGARGVEVRVSGAGEGEVAAFSEMAVAARGASPGPPADAFRVRFLWSRLLAGRVAGRLSPSLWIGYSLLSRLTWMREGARIALDRAVFGAGGGGWGALIGQYQSYPYYSSEVHCHPIQVWVEAGTGGLLLYLLAWSAFGLQLLRAARAGAAASLAGMAAGAAALFVQSAFDASISFPAVGALLVIAWGLCGAAAVRPSRAFWPALSRLVAVRWVAARPRLVAMTLRTGAALLVCALALGTIAGISAASARTQARHQDAEAALAAWRRAAMLVPLSADYHMKAARTARTLAERSESEHDRYADLALTEIKRAAELDPYNAQVISLCGLIQLHSGELQAGLQSLDRALALQPYWSIHYDNLATMAMGIAEKLCLINRPDEAQKLTGRIVTLESELAGRARRMPSWVMSTLRTPGTTPVVSFEVGRALLLRGQAADALQRLETAAQLYSGAIDDQDRGKLGQALAWLAYGYEVAGDAEKASTMLARALEADPEAEQVLATARRAGKAAGLTPLQDTGGER